MITRALPTIAVLIVMVMVIFIVRYDDIIIITPVGAIPKVTEVSAIQAMYHTGT